MDGDTSGPFSSSSYGAYHGYSQPSRGTPLMRHSGCPSHSRSSGDRPRREVQLNGATHSLTPHSDSFCFAMDQDIDSKEVMKIDAYEDYRAPRPDAYYEKMMKLMQQLTKDQQKNYEELGAKFSKMKIDFDSKLSTLTCHIKLVEDQVKEVKDQLYYQEVKINEHGEKFYCMSRNINQVEEHLEWKIEALQQGFNDPNDYAKWKNDQAYLAYDQEEEQRATGEELTSTIKPLEEIQQYHQTDEEKAYFGEQTIGSRFGDLNEDFDKFKDLTTEEDSEEEDLGEVHCYMTTRIPYEEIPENHNFHQFRNQGESIHRANSGPPPAPYYPYEDWRPAPGHYQNRFPHPYLRRTEDFQNRFPRNHLSRRLPHQLFQDHANTYSQQKSLEEKLEGLLKQCLRQQEVNTRKIHERIDMIEGSIWGLASRITRLEWKHEDDELPLECTPRQQGEVESDEDDDPLPSVPCNTVSIRKEVQPLQELEEGEIFQDEDANLRRTSLPRNPHGLSLLRNRWYPHVIGIRELGDFNRAVGKLPRSTSFAKACSVYHIDRFFLESSETRTEIRELYEQALHYPRPFRTLHKVDSPGRFLITCSIRGVEFKDALCDSGSCINLMSMRAAEKIGLSTLQPSGIRIGLANSSSTTPEGMISDIHVRIGNCNVPTDFQVINVEKGRPSQLILGGSFLATTGAIIDWPNRRISFANIDREVFYEVVPFVPTSQRPRRRSNDPRGKPPNIGNIKKLCLRTEDSSHIA